ncbi:hypothetical protein SALBM135S_01985 [Streptomyces alboniger]
MTTSTGFDIRRIGGRIGAEIHGVDLSAELEPAIVTEINSALLAHKALVFRDQHLDDAGQLRFASLFGALTTAHPTVPSVEGQPEILPVDGDEGIRANNWHTDVTFVRTPPKASTLRSIVVPPYGGNTLIANRRRLPDLPDALRDLADRLWAVHTNDHDYAAPKSGGRRAPQAVGPQIPHRAPGRPRPSRDRRARLQSGSVDGAWVPEPTASKLVAEGGKVLLDKSDLWPDKKFVITNIIVSQKFLKEHPDVVKAVLRGSVKTNAWINDNPEKAKASANAALKKLSGKALPAEIIDPAWKSITFLDDPLAATLDSQAEHAVEAGLLDEPDLKGIYDLGPLNKVLEAEGAKRVDDAGLGVK